MNLDYIDSLLLYIIIFSISIISFYLSIRGYEIISVKYILSMIKVI